MNYKLVFTISGSGLAGFIWGILSTYFIFGFLLTILFGGVVATAIGLCIVDKKTAKWSGVLFGACLTITFLFSVFQGTSDKLLSFALLSMFIIFFGAIFGSAFMSMGSWVKREYFS